MPEPRMARPGHSSNRAPISSIRMHAKSQVPRRVGKSCVLDYFPSAL